MDSFSSAISSLCCPVRGSSTLSTASLRASNSPRTSSKITSSEEGQDNFVPSLLASSSHNPTAAQTSALADARLVYRTESTAHSDAPAALNSISAEGLSTKAEKQATSSKITPSKESSGKNAALNAVTADILSKNMLYILFSVGCYG